MEMLIKILIVVAVFLYGVDAVIIGFYYCLKLYYHQFGSPAEREEMAIDPNLIRKSRDGYWEPNVHYGDPFIGMKREETPDNIAARDHLRKFRNALDDIVKGKE